MSLCVSRVHSRLTPRKRYPFTACIRTNYRDKYLLYNYFWFSLSRMRTLWKLSVEHRGGAQPLLRRWSDSTGCSIAVGSCYWETQGEAGTLLLMVCPKKAPRITLTLHIIVGSGEQCFPTMGPTNRNMRLSPKTTRAMPSALPNTACWLSSPWTCLSSSTGQIFT